MKTLIGFAVVLLLLTVLFCTPFGYSVLQGLGIVAPEQHVVMVPTQTDPAFDAEQAELVRLGHLHDCLVTVKDVDGCNRIWGKP